MADGDTGAPVQDELSEAEWKAIMEAKGDARESVAWILAQATGFLVAVYAIFSIVDHLLRLTGWTPLIDW